MRYAVVAVAQQALRLYPDVETYRREMERFFRLAEGKHARLIIFPERTGLMIVPPLIEGFRAGLIKKAAPRRGRRSNWWDRTRSSVMRGTAKILGADLRQEVRKILEEMPDFVWQRYVDTFAELAYEYKVTVVAGSGYFKPPDSQAVHHVVTVFGPDGDVLGQHRKVLLDEEEATWAEPGTGWHTVDTPVGRLGLVLGEEVMYPEVGRLLAYQGMDALIALAAVRDDARGQILREGTQARVTDNQVFAALAFTVGQDPLADEGTPPYRGRSVILAPQGLTPRRGSILVESGAATGEVLLTARWDMEALHRYWESAPIPVRRRVPTDKVGSVLAAIYSQQVTLEEAVRVLPHPWRRALTEFQEEEGEERAEARVEEGPAEAAPEETVVPAPEPAEAETPTAEAVPEETVVAAPEPAVAETPPTAEEAPTAEAAPEETVVAPTPEPAEAEAPPAAEEAPTAEGIPQPEVAEVPGVEAEAVEVIAEPPAPPPEEEEAMEEPASEVFEATEEVEGKGPAEREAPPERPSEPQTEVATSPPEEVEEIPAHLWATIKKELEEAARVLRSLTQEEATAATEPQEEGPQEPPPRTEAPERPPTSPQGGWFHSLVQRGRGRSEDEEPRE